MSYQFDMESAGLGLVHQLKLRLFACITLTSLLFAQASAQQDFDINQPHPQFDQFSVAARCPLSCDTGNSWALYGSLDDLSTCNRTVLLSLNLYNKIEGPSTSIGIRSCTVGGSAARLKGRQTFVVPSSNSTPSTFDAQQEVTNIRINTKHGHGNATLVEDAISALANHVQHEKDGTTTALFAKSGDTIAAVYGGLQIEKKALSTLISDFVKHFDPENVTQATAQHCKKDGLNTQAFGIFVSKQSDISTAQAALGGWNKAECLSSTWDAETAWPSARVSMIPGSQILVGPATSRNSTLSKRATCSYTQAVAGDGCWALADRCKITQAQLVQHNGDSELCSQSKVQLGKYYCCSSGTLPDFSPQPNSDGSCKTHIVSSTDLCYIIAEKYSMTVQQLQDRNKNTWGWLGCSYLIADQVICVSTGSPPMPAVDPLATCGPTVAGTQRPSDMSKLADLNPCPLKACCNVWGNCGISKDFCILNPADTGAPGTTQPGANSCVSSCGLSITNNGSPPASFMRVGYFEAWNLNRPCLHMLPRHINLDYYTHLHFAFADITPSFGVSLGNLKPVFEEFKSLAGVKKIVSFGGWSFSTEADTYPIFREGVTAAQRLTFATNVVQFAIDNNLDGLDFDWEYPSAPDIPGIPPGSPQDGQNYLEFLIMVRKMLPAGKTIGIAAPASFWYLKGFPIAKMSKVVDYIIYMTYDLHGQWDYGNKWASDGCPGGDCLRHHTNRTETELSLVMVTKAGVPSNKIIVGMPLYGRSFKMTTTGCTGPQCTFVGKESAAAPGRCTGTRGYVSNYEIREIMASKNTLRLKTAEDDDIVVYDGTEWIAWMPKEKYTERADWIKGLNFGGTSDWAIDLDGDYDVGSSPGGGGSTLTTVVGGITLTLQPGQTITTVGPDGRPTTISNPSGGAFTTVIGGTTTTINGVPAVIGGTTITLRPGQTITATGPDGRPTTIFPPSNSGPITTVVGGTTTTISGTRTVIGGTTLTLKPGDDPITTTIDGRPTTILPPVVSATPTGGFPVVTNSQCRENDCVNGRCIGPLCVSFGCSGRDCMNGKCTGSNCTPSGCIGPDCQDGECRGRKCWTEGCRGDDCEDGSDDGGGNGICRGLKCISVGCIGLDCLNGICVGPNCTKRSCSGPNCYSGTCAGAQCRPNGGNKGGGDGASSAPPEDPNNDDSCTTKREFPTCSTKYVIITSATEGQTSRRTTTSTSSTCYTVTACTGATTTIRTTSTTATTVPVYCAKGGCSGAQCNSAQKRQEALPPNVAAVTTDSLPERTSLPILESKTKKTFQNPSTKDEGGIPTNVSIIARDIPQLYTDTCRQFYDDVERLGETVTLDNEAETDGTQSSVVAVKWGYAKKNIYVKDVYGCTVILASSHIGAVAVHIWERPTFRGNRYEQDIEPILNYFGPLAGLYYLGSVPAITIMTPAGPSLGENDGRESLLAPSSDALRYPEYIGRIRNRIQQLIPEGSITTHGYNPQANVDARGRDCWGRSAILFDPNHRYGGETFPPGHGMNSHVVQAHRSVENTGFFEEFQIWRVNGLAGNAVNVAIQAQVDSWLDVCNGGTADRRGSEFVERGSEITDVGPEDEAGSGRPGTPFYFIDKWFNILYDNCVYKGGDYADNADGGRFAAGVLTCGGGRTIRCTRPYDNLATTCGGRPANQCGKLGVDCLRYYQKIATCRP